MEDTISTQSVKYIFRPFSASTIAKFKIPTRHNNLRQWTMLLLKKWPIPGIRSRKLLIKSSATR